eukprot:COSAG06_NODE_18893_length_863_cov_1.113874_1_plen_268_part_01
MSTTTTTTATTPSGTTTTTVTSVVVAASSESPAAQSKLTFRYWNCQGRGQLSRYMLYDSGMDFVDEIVDVVEVFGGGKWPDLKVQEAFAGPFRALPVVNHLGTNLNETGACAQYVAELCGYMPTDAMERAQVVMVCDHIYEDVLINIAYSIWNLREWERDAIGGFAGPTSGVPTKFANLEQMLTKSTSGYIVGDQITMADFSVFMVVDVMHTHLLTSKPSGPEAFKLLLGDKPALLKHHAMVGARPNTTKHRESDAFNNYGRFLTGKG